MCFYVGVETQYLQSNKSRSLTKFSLKKNKKRKRKNQAVKVEPRRNINGKNGLNEPEGEKNGFLELDCIWPESDQCSGYKKIKDSCFDSSSIVEDV